MTRIVTFVARHRIHVPVTVARVCLSTLASGQASRYQIDQSKVPVKTPPRPVATAMTLPKLVDTTTLNPGQSPIFFSTAASYDDPGDHETTSSVPFLLADIGEGIKEVELLQWFVEEGDHVSQFDKICEVQSDKATVEITSRYDGTILSLAGQVGDMMQVGSPLLYLQPQHMDDDTVHKNTPTTTTSPSLSSSTPGSSHSKNSATTELDKENESLYYNDLEERLSIPSIATHYKLASDTEENDTGNDRSLHQSTDTASAQKKSRFDNDTSMSMVATSPAVRKLGKEYQLDLSTIHPSGPHGRLLKSDVITYLKEHGMWRETKQPEKETTTVAATSLPSTEKDTDTAPKHVVGADTDSALDHEIVQLKGYHRLMVQSMTAALKIPHMCFGDELVVTDLVRFRQQLKANMDSAPSLLSFFIKACSMALTEYPIVNSLVHDADQCQLKMVHNHDIGIAIDTPRGLVVPVIRQVQTKSVLDIQNEVSLLRTKALESKLGPDDLQDATFTLSNIGSIGGTYMQPVIVPPQLAMGAIGRVQTLPRFVSDDTSGEDADESNLLQIQAAKVMHVSWAGDHRFLDGATLARFHTAFKKYVEQPTHMLLHLK